MAVGSASNGLLILPATAPFQSKVKQNPRIFILYFVIIIRRATYDLIKAPGRGDRLVFGVV
jgi:hypothetical protein